MKTHSNESEVGIKRSVLLHNSSERLPGSRHYPDYEPHAGSDSRQLFVCASRGPFYLVAVERESHYGVYLSDYSKHIHPFSSTLTLLIMQTFYLFWRVFFSKSVLPSACVCSTPQLIWWYDHVQGWGNTSRILFPMVLGLTVLHLSAFFFKETLIHTHCIHWYNVWFWLCWMMNLFIFLFQKQIDDRLKNIFFFSRLESNNDGNWSWPEQTVFYNQPSILVEYVLALSSVWKNLMLNRTTYNISIRIQSHLLFRNQVLFCYWLLTSVVVQKELLAVDPDGHGVKCHSHLHVLSNIKSTTGGRHWERPGREDREGKQTQRCGIVFGWFGLV